MRKVILIGVGIYLVLVILTGLFKIDNPSDKDYISPDPIIVIDSNEVRIQDSIVHSAFKKKDTTPYISHPVDIQ